MDDEIDEDMLHDEALTWLVSLSPVMRKAVRNASGVPGRRMVTAANQSDLDALCRRDLIVPPGYPEDTEWPVFDYVGKLTELGERVYQLAIEDEE